MRRLITIIIVGLVIIGLTGAGAWYIDSRQQPISTVLSVDKQKKQKEKQQKQLAEWRQKVKQWNEESKKAKPSAPTAPATASTESPSSEVLPNTGPGLSISVLTGIIAVSTLSHWLVSYRRFRGPIK